MVILYGHRLCVILSVIRMRGVLPRKGRVGMTTERMIIGPNASVAWAAKLLLRTGGDTLWVCEGGKTLGVVTKQDLLRAYVRRLDAADTRVAEIMEGQDHFAPENRERGSAGESGLPGLVVPDHGRWS
jgi:CBS domain-containing protein